MMNAAATFRTFGHLSSATIVNKLPHMPTIMISIVITAANVSNGRPNLDRIYSYLVEYKTKFVLFNDIMFLICWIRSSIIRGSINASSHVLR